MCAALRLSPREAREQDPIDVHDILEYRAARAAVDAFNAKDKAQAFAQLQHNPHLLELLARMHRAQQGLALSPDEGGAGRLRAEGGAVFEEYYSGQVAADED